MKKRLIISFTAATLFCAPVVTNATPEQSATEITKQTEYAKASTDVTATVKSIDYKTRKISLIVDGEPYDIVAGEEVKNLNQIKKGDIVRAQYTEAIAYNINKGGKMASPKVSETEWTARPGQKPEAGTERKITTSVTVSEIDRKEPSVTLKGPSGDTKTFKVMHPERLERVKVGDVVDVTYSEAMAVKVEKKSKQNL